MIDRAGWIADGRDVGFQRGVEAAASIVDDSANDALLHYPGADRHHILRANAKAIREEAAAKYAYDLRFSPGAWVGADPDTRRQWIQALQKGVRI